MKKVNISINALFLTVSMIGILQFTSCKIDDIDTYNSKNALWFERSYYDSDLGTTGKWVRLDTIEISSTFFPGVAEYVHPFKINLIGVPFAEDTKYEMELIDTLSQAEALKYIDVPRNPVFGAGVVSDSLKVAIHVGKIPQDFRGYVTFKLKETDIFRQGYKGHETIKIWINNIPTKPLWWKKTVEQAYLGKYSAKKYAEFVKHTKLLTLEGLEAIEKRNICKDFKAYVELNKITEEDGSPMVIPIY